MAMVVPNSFKRLENALPHIPNTFVLLELVG
jgi:hypothetical protein